MAKPVPRQAITSEWSPKIESACIARERADTWKTVEVSSPAILNIFGIISSNPWEAVNVVLSEPDCQCAMNCTGSSAFGLHFHHRGTVPQRFGLLAADQASENSPMLDEGVIG